MNYIALFLFLLKGEVNMFDKITKALTKKVITNAKETVKEELSEEVDTYIPMILGLVSIGVALFSVCGSTKPKVIHESTTIINNYYIYLGGDK